MQLCVYCGIEAGITSDHVPPKCLFPEPRPSDLVTVPCCESCRRSQSDDDEYFKNMIVMRDDVAKSEQGSRILDSVHRALARSEKRRFTDDLLSTAREVDVYTLAGLYIRKGTTYSVDIRRLDKVMRRTLLGLYFYETGDPLPDTHGAIVYTVSALQGLSIKQQASVQRVIEIALTGKIQQIGGGVFTYVIQSISSLPHRTIWLFTLYERVGFIGMTGSREDLPVSALGGR